MLSIVVRSFGGPEVLEIVERPDPTPGPGQLRVRVVASSVNPIDLSARAGRLTQAGLMAPSREVGLGWDVAGHVDALGAGVTRFELGQAVIGLRDLLFAPGAHAEQVVLDASAVAPAPRSASLVDAASLPLNALTADRCLELASVRCGQTVLVTGAAGGVGGFVLQLAAVHGVATIAVVRRGDEDFVRDLGATAVVPPDDAGASLGTAVRAVAPGGVDAVIDAANLGVAAHDALRSGGVFVALVAPFAPPPIRATRVVVQETFADGARLAELSALVDAGVLTPRVARSFPLTEASAAHELLEAGGVRGRVLLLP
jgi:NADPH:quinone reductase-like Zn-dependent oxidoreductase